MSKLKYLVAASAATLSLSLFAASETSLEQRVQLLEQQLQTKNQLQSDMSMQMIELQKEVKDLRGIIEEQQYKLKQIQDRQRDLYREIEDRMSARSSQPAQQPATSTPPATTPPVVSPNVANQVKQTVAGGNERSEYEAAFELVRKREFTQAVQAFEQFIAKYPGSNYSGNARFWIGQVYFVEGKYTDSEQNFELMRSQYPDSAKLPQAMLKLAEIKVMQQDWEAAKALYTEIEQKYTGSVQQVARKGLQDIKAKGH